MMALFGGRNRGLSAGLAATPEELERQRRLEAISGISPMQAGTAIQQGEPQLPDLRVAETSQGSVHPGSIDPDVLKMVGSAPIKKNNTARDVLGGLLAAVSDGLARQSGQKGHAVDNLTKAWTDRRATFKTQQEQYQDRMRMAQLPGMTTREMAAYMADPKAWGGHMASAATSPYQAATLNPGDNRFLGQGKPMVQAPTRGQQYARTLGLSEGTDPYNDAIRDQELGANGPTAFGNQQNLAGLRFGQQRTMEQLRQANRLSLRGVPTYRDSNPPPPRPSVPRSAPRRAMPTATGPNGEKVMWNGRAWVPGR